MFVRNISAMRWHGFVMARRRWRVIPSSWGEEGEFVFDYDDIFIAEANDKISGVRNVVTDRPR